MGFREVEQKSIKNIIIDLMKHMPKSTYGTFLSQAIFEKYHGTFLVIIMLKFVSYIRYTVKKSMKLNK